MTYVLVHGGGFDARCWDPLLPHLDRPAVAVDLPGRSTRPAALAALTIATFVAAVVDELVSADLQDVVLVGHSLAGITLPGVMAAAPERLRHVAFVSCSVPATGTSVLDGLAGFSPAASEVVARLGEDLADDDGLLHPDLAAAMFCNDMPDDLRDWTLSRRVPESMGVLSEPVELTGLTQPVPRTYVRLLQDASLDLPTQDQMAANVHGPPLADVVDVDAAHMAMISRPDRLAEVLATL
jgi:pimeloyl-ACP methyl ester carboxylesterase